MAASKKSNSSGASVSPPSKSMVSDPGLGGSVETDYGKVDGSSPTNGPNRMTVHVPTDTTVLSIGAANPTPWKTDIGIVGYSDQHIHFETKANDPTIVSLGGPATTAAITGHGGVPPKSSSGYSMVTSKNAWHEAQLQHYLLSRESDVSIRSMAKRAVVQADHGFVDLNAKEVVNVAAGSVAIGASTTIKIVPITYGQNCADVHNDSTFAATSKLYADRIGMISATFDLYKKAKKLWPKLSWNKLKADKAAWLDPVKWSLDAVKWGISAYKALNLHHDTKGAPDECVKITAQKTVAAFAGEDISLNGTKAASMGGGVGVSVSAMTIATLKGAAWAGVGSLLTSVRGRRRLELNSPWGEVNLGANTDIGCTADHEFSAAAKRHASVSAGTKLLFGASTRTFIGAQEGAFGFLLDKEGVAFGGASNVDKMKTATINDTPAIRINTTQIAIAASGDTSITLGSTLSIKAKTVSFQANADSATFKGSLIRLGC
jgi:hypothetical protein